MENDAKRLADKALHAKDALVEGAIEFKDEEIKSGGGAKAFVAGGFGGICTVLVGESKRPVLIELSEGRREGWSVSQCGREGR